MENHQRKLSSNVNNCKPQTKSKTNISDTKFEMKKIKKLQNSV